MSHYKINFILRELKHKVTFDQGLTEAEIDAVEKKYNFVFPPDLKMLLQKKLPVSSSFINWRKALTSSDYKMAVKERLKWPLNGVLFDIKNNEFWLQDWGDKPTNYVDQEEIAKRAVAKAPKLIPIMSHRYVPADPSRAGNPVLSVYQTDIVYYGNDLLSYFAAEFGFSIPQDLTVPQEPRNIRFWSKLVT